MAEKKTDKKTQTKAGMLGKKGSLMDNEEEKDLWEINSSNTPKIKKEKAEENNNDKPIHWF